MYCRKNKDLIVKRNIKKSMVSVLMLGLFIGLSACQTSVAKHETAMDHIQQSLEQGMQQNDAVAKRQRYSVPASIDAALVPKVSSRGFVKAPGQKRFDVNVKDVEARTFYMGLVKDTPYSMIVSPEVKGLITLSLKNVTIDEVMQATRDMYSHEYRRTRYGYDVLANQIETRMFVVNYLDILRTGRTQTQGNSGQISEKLSTTNIGGSSDDGTQITSQETSAGSRVTTFSQMDFWTSLKTSLDSMIGDKDGHAVIINATAGLVIIKAYPRELRRVADYLRQLQSRVGRQVILEARILEVLLSDSYEAGIDWNALQKDLTQTGLDTTFQNTAIDATFNQIFKINVSAGGKNGFNAVIDLLSTQGNVQVLSSPRISTMNNQKALIKVGQDEFFVTGVSTTTSVSGNTTVPTEDIELTPFFSGINLDVTPQISSDDSVTLHIHPSISRVQDQTKILTLRDQEFSLPLARSEIRETDTIVHAKNRQVIVLGGLMQNRMVEDVASTPILGDIPFFGTFFRHTRQVATKTELVILLRPILVESGTWNKRLSDSSQRFKKVSRGFKVGGKTEIFGNEGERDVSRTF